jgi:hypothetical protein
MVSSTGARSRATVFARPLGRQVESRLSLPILDFDDPDVGIERQLPPEPLFRALVIDPFRVVHSDEDSLDAALGVEVERLRGGPVKRRPPVQTVDLDQDRSGVPCAPAPQHRRRSLRAAAPQIGGDPHVGPQAHLAGRARGRRKPRQPMRVDLGRRAQCAFEGAEARRAGIGVTTARRTGCHTLRLPR